TRDNMEHPPRSRIRAYCAPVSFEGIEQLFLPGKVLARHGSLVKTVRDPPSTVRVASSVLHLTNPQFMGRSAVSNSYNTSRGCARRDSSCVLDFVRASLAGTKNLRATEYTFQGASSLTLHLNNSSSKSSPFLHSEEKSQLRQTAC